MVEDPFKEYIKEGEPGKAEKAYAWSTAIGLQAVDGLKVSPYLVELASRNIEGEISLEKVDSLLKSYYQDRPSTDRTDEADEVSERIAYLLSEKAFSFSLYGYIFTHKKLFQGIFPHAGQIRDYNITKKEWVLEGDTIYYCSADEIKDTLEYDLGEEEKFSYKNLSIDEVIHHLAVFVAGLWQIHAFGEGNTRTTAVFFIKYLRTLGFDATNDVFAKNAWYFRNALVRANYSNLKKGIHETTDFLELFLRNLLKGENNPLHNREMHISGAFNISKKTNIEYQKANIDGQKANIQGRKSNIEDHFKGKTASNVHKLFESFGCESIFGRSDVQKTLGLKPTRSSALIKEMFEYGIIEPAVGEGKGKYRFKL